MPRPDKFHIYRLVDPRCPTQTKYIGRSLTPFNRHIQHCMDVSGTLKGEWIELMRLDGVFPQMLLIEIVQGFEQAKQRELFWIEHYLAEGAQLTNERGVDRPKTVKRVITRSIIMLAPLTTSAPNTLASSGSLDQAEQSTRKALLHEAMMRSNGNKTLAAKLLGVSRPTLYGMLIKFGENLTSG